MSFMRENDSLGHVNDELHLILTSCVDLCHKEKYMVGLRKLRWFSPCTHDSGNDL